MKRFSTNEISDRRAYEILRLLLFPTIVLMCVLLLSVYIISVSDNEFSVTLCSTMIGLTTVFWLVHLIYIFLYKDRIVNKSIISSVPRWFKCYSKCLYKLLSLIGKESILINNALLSLEPLTIQKLKKQPSTLIEWEKYPDELKRALEECWTMNTSCPKSLRLAAPLVCLIEVNIVSSSLNYSKTIAFLREKFQLRIDNTQLSDECRLLQAIIESPSKFQDRKKDIQRLEYYNFIKSKLSFLY